MRKYSNTSKFLSIFSLDKSFHISKIQTQPGLSCYSDHLGSIASLCWHDLSLIELDVMFYNLTMPKPGIGFCLGSTIHRMDEARICLFFPTISGYVLAY